MTTRSFPSLFDMSTLEQQPQGVDGSQSHEPIVGELMFDKFAKSQPRHQSFATPVVKSEFESPILDVASQAAHEDPASSQSDLDQFFASSADSTPLFGLEDVESDPQTWTSLFDDDISVSVSDPVHVESREAQTSLSIPTDEFFEAAPEPVTIIDQRSFLPTPVIEDAKIPVYGKKSASSGAIQKPKHLDQLGLASYNRKNRATPLTPVIPESDDPVTVKRAKNTEAARRSRARKLQRMNQLEDTVEELLKKNTQLEHEVATLRSLLGSQG
ncbi:LADA_0E12992g1_1 [Lachancea dasiensis]|uniref:LADA_0E12992g1_1 n=1 Tax=Lachancea dasiensis TaxID=1072105 RepID=A0A1G4JG52_9SACH|nr:LADA_0E12992g1_1 [Lachancea dasiensis]